MTLITQNISLVAETLRRGEIAAIPTETVYGLAAILDNENAVKKVFDLKKRPYTHPLIAHIGKGWDITEWACDIPNYAFELMEQFWPGPLTLVFKAKEKTETALSRGYHSTIAIRCPDHPITQKLLDLLKVPLVAPSANPFGKISPTTALHVQKSFDNFPLLILDGGRCAIGIESTIVSALSDTPHILREGMLTSEMLSIQESEKNEIRPAAPGDLESHYQPNKPLFCFKTKEELLNFIENTKNAYVLSFDETYQLASFGTQIPRDPIRLAHELYYQLRIADESNATSIAIELPPFSHETAAICERLMKAKNKEP